MEPSLTSWGSAVHRARWASRYFHVIDLINVLDTELGFALCQGGFLEAVRKWNFGEIDDLKYGQED